MNMFPRSPRNLVKLQDFKIDRISSYRHCCKIKSVRFILGMFLKIDQSLIASLYAMGRSASVDCVQRRLCRVARAQGNSRMKWILHVHMGIIGGKMDFASHCVHSCKIKIAKTLYY